MKVRILEDETCQVAAFNHEGEKCEAAFEFTGSEEKIEAFTEISESSSEVESKTSGETGSDVSESRVKNKTAPDTSDFVNVFYFWLMLISAGGISAAALYIIFKKKQE